MARQIKIDNAELKRRQYQKPQNKTKSARCRILIVCEGEKTEPNYFKAFDKIQRGVFVFDVKTHGEGKDTLNVVNKAIELRDDAIKQGNPYDSVWAVFDRDSFSANRFNAAIFKARENDIGCAWSNEAFELWYILHFHNRKTAMSRDEYKEKISDAVNNSPQNKTKNQDYKYAKNAIDNHRIVNEYGSQDNAIKWAKACHQEYDNEKFDTHNPCTTVYKLVLQLIGKDQEFLNKVSEKIDALPPK